MFLCMNTSELGARKQERKECFILRKINWPETGSHCKQPSNKMISVPSTPVAFSPTSRDVSCLKQGRPLFRQDRSFSIRFMLNLHINQKINMKNQGHLLVDFLMQLKALSSHQPTCSPQEDMVRVQKHAFVLNGICDYPTSRETLGVKSCQHGRLIRKKHESIRN